MNQRFALPSTYVFCGNEKNISKYKDTIEITLRGYDFKMYPNLNNLDYERLHEKILILDNQITEEDLMNLKGLDSFIISFDNKVKNRYFDSVVDNVSPSKLRSIILSPMYKNVGNKLNDFTL